MAKPFLLSWVAATLSLHLFGIVSEFKRLDSEFRESFSVGSLLILTLWYGAFSFLVISICWVFIALPYSVILMKRSTYSNRWIHTFVGGFFGFLVAMLLSLHPYLTADSKVVLVPAAMLSGAVGAYFVSIRPKP